MNQAAHAHSPAVLGSAISAVSTGAQQLASLAGGHPAILDGVEAVVFDFDGTLADTTPSHQQALREVLRPYGLDLDLGWYSRHAGLSIRDLLATLPGGRHLPHHEIIQASRARLLETIHRAVPIDSVITLLRAARRAGLPCAIASGASRVLVQPGLEALGLTTEFAVVVTVEDVRHGKPAPDLFTEAARRLGVPPGRCLAIDDAPDGVTAARAAGMHVLTVHNAHLAPAGGSGEPPSQAHRHREPEPAASPGSPHPAAPHRTPWTPPSTGGA